MQPQDSSAESLTSRLSWWRVLRDSLSGAEHNYTSIDLNKSIVLLAIPMILEMVMESVFAVVDVFYVSRLGADAVATVGVTESMVTIVFAVALGLAMATTAMVARRIGEGNREAASVAAMQAIWIGIAVSLAIGVVGFVFGGEFLRLMGAEPGMLATGTTYTRVLLTGCGTVLMLFLINAIFRGAGNAAIAMRVLWIANGINLVLDPCLIFGLGPFPEMGVAGAAVATTIGRGTGVAIQIWALTEGRRSHPTGEAPPGVALGHHRETVAGVFHGDAAILHRNGELGGDGAHHRNLRQPCAGGLHDRHSRGDLHHFAVVGIEQRGSNAGWTKPGGGLARPRREIRVGERVLQHALSGLGEYRVHLLSGANHSHLYRGCGSDPGGELRACGSSPTATLRTPMAW